MIFQETDADRRFRGEARNWLEGHVPKEPRPAGSGPDARAYDLEWQRCQHEGGRAGVSWPVEYGGLGLPAHLQVIWYEEYARAGGPDVGASFVGLNHGGPTLIACGTEAQKQEHLRKILQGEVLWCQGFSEPEAGSDLAALRTRAVLDGDELVVTGQKIWTSYADIADYQELLVRTDATGPKHHGITWLIADMSVPGVEVRPIQTIAGGGHFAEVFYDEARFPVSSVVGAIDAGWAVTLTTLSFERGTAFIAEQMRLARVVRDLLHLAEQVPAPTGRGPAIDSDDVRQQLGWLIASVESLRAMTYHLVSKAAHVDGPIPDGSVTRAWFSTLAQQVARLAFDLRGWSSMEQPHGTLEDRDWNHEYFWSFQETIGGGTLEIQKNIVGQRLLGLPRG
jgi:alkylation response protein AidB-like acyl-CoA dehydrogenase